jgi:hypothetical protein
MQYSFDAERHCHALDGKSLLGASTVVGVLNKPLTWWASGLAVMKFGWINSKTKVNGKYKTIPLVDRLQAVAKMLQEIKQMTDVQFLDLCDEAYKAHSVKLDDSAVAGTNMHAVLENYVKECMSSGSIMLATTDFAPLKAFSRWAVDNVDHFVYSEAYGYSETLWVGGISDLGAILKEKTPDGVGKRALIDFKSSKEAYDSQFIQAGVYDLIFSENGILNLKGERVGDWSPADAFIVFPFGAEKPEAQVRYDTEACRQAARDCISLYKFTNKTNFK